MKSLTKIILILSLSFPIVGISQIDDINFTKSNATYAPLTQGISLTDGFTEEDWGMYYLEYELKEPIQINVGEEVYVFTYLEINFDGLVFLDGLSITNLEEVFVVLAPFDDILDYAYSEGDDENNSEILYRFEDGVSHIEFRNLTFFFQEFLDVSPDARFTFRVAIEHDGGKVTYHYGPNRFQEAIYDIMQDSYFFIGLGIEIYLSDEEYSSFFAVLQGDSNDPGYVLLYDDEWEIIEGLNNLPEEETIYEFEFIMTSSSTSQIYAPLSIQVAPNPGNNSVQILHDQVFKGPITVYVSDMMGRIVLKDILFDSMILNTEYLISGLYNIKVISEEGSAAVQWVKQ